jgi:hypothetical protein
MDDRTGRRAGEATAAAAAGAARHAGGAAEQLQQDATREELHQLRATREVKLRVMEEELDAAQERSCNSSAPCLKRSCAPRKRFWTQRRRSCSRAPRKAKPGDKKAELDATQEKLQLQQQQDATQEGLAYRTSTCYAPSSMASHWRSCSSPITPKEILAIAQEDHPQQGAAREELQGAVWKVKARTMEEVLDAAQEELPQGTARKRS